MAGGCLILCILIQVLLITTAYGGQTKILINCQNQYWIEEKPLTLTCNVTCYKNDGCSSTHNYTWSKTDNPDIRCKEKNRAITKGKSHTFNCTIENPTWKQDTFTFWVQMTTGPKDTTFNVTIVSSDIRQADPSESFNSNSESQTDKSGRSNAVAVAVIVILCLATVVGVLLMKYNASILALCSRKMITEANIL